MLRPGGVIRLAKTACLLVALYFTGCAKEIIATEQTEGEAIRLLNLLGKEGVTAEKIRNKESRDIRFDVQVAKDDEARAYGVMVRFNLPETRKDGTGELFKEGGLVPTSEQQRAKREVGVKGDIENAMRRFPRVVEAVASVSIPEDNPLRDVNEAKPKPKAAVAIMYLNDEKGQPPISVEEVQRFVQAALPELRSTEVAVQLVPVSERAMAGGGGTSGATGAPLQNACEKTKSLGVDVCIGSEKSLRNMIVGAVIVAFVLAGLAVVSVLRALRYRKDLTRLTAQVAQLKK
jgi:type III secretion system YscJ/HrcJ family lipoprotein